MKNQKPVITGLGLVLEGRLTFIGEERTESYMPYGEGSTEAKNDNMTQEKRQVSGCAGKQDASAHEPDEVSYSAVSKWNSRVTTIKTLALSI